MSEALRNALAALPAQRGSVGIRTSRRDGDDIIEIADNGPGMAADATARAMDGAATATRAGSRWFAPSPRSTAVASTS